MHRDQYFENVMNVPSEHDEAIEHIQVAPCGTRFTTTSRHEVKIWSLKPEIKCLVSIPLEDREDEGQSVD